MAYTKADKEGWIPKIREDNKTVYQGELLPDIPTFNLDRLNMLELTRQLEANLNSPTSNFIFFKRRNNTKLQLDRERIQLLTATIADLRLSQEQLVNLQAETFLNQKRLKSLLDGFEAQLEINALKLQDEKLRMEEQQELRQIEIDKKQLENTVLAAQANTEMAKALIIEKFSQQIDFSNLSPALYDRVIQSLMGTTPVDTDLQERMKGITIRVEEAKAIKEESQADVSRATADKSVKKLKEIK